MNGGKRLKFEPKKLKIFVVGKLSNPSMLAYLRKWKKVKDFT